MSELLSQLIRERETKMANMDTSPNFASTVNTLYGNMQYGRTNSHNPQKSLDGYNHFRGRPYSVITFLARKIAERPVRISRIMTTDERIVQEILKKHGKPHRKPIKEEDCPVLYKELAKNMMYDDEHPLHNLFRNPNPMFTWFDIMFSTVCSLELTGQAFIWMVQDGETFQCWPMPTHWVTLVPDPDCVLGRWRVNPNGVAGFELDFHDLVHIRYVSPFDPMSSYGPMEAMAFPIAAAETIQIAQQKAFENGIHPGLALIVGDGDGSTGNFGRPLLDKEQRQMMIDLVKRAYQGAYQFGNPLILDALIQDVKPITTAPAEMDFTGSDQLVTKKIEQGWGVSPFLLGEMEGANRATATVVEQMTNTNVLNPRIQNVNSALTRYFQRRIDKGDKTFINLELCEKKDIDFSLQQAMALFTQGAITYNQLLTSQGYPTIEGGDILAKPLGMQPPKSTGGSMGGSGGGQGGGPSSDRPSAMDLSVGNPGGGQGGKPSRGSSDSSNSGPTSAPPSSSSSPAPNPAPNPAPIAGLGKAARKRLKKQMQNIEKSYSESNDRDGREYVLNIAVNFYLTWLQQAKVLLGDASITYEVSKEFLEHCQERIEDTLPTKVNSTLKKEAAETSFVILDSQDLLLNEISNEGDSAILSNFSDCYALAYEIVTSYLASIGERSDYFEEYFSHGA